MSCRECGLNVHSEPTCIPGTGSIKSDIMIINSYATDHDEDNREATMSRELLRYLEGIGIDENQVYYTNLVKCRIPKGTKVKVSEWKKCAVHMRAEIDRIKPKYVMLIGAIATKAILDKAITTINGVVFEIDGIKYISSFSPGIIFRDPSKTSYVNKAFQNFKDMVGGLERKLPDLNIIIVDTVTKIKQSFIDLKKDKVKYLSYDIEATGLNRFEDKVTLFGYGNDKVQYILPMECKYSPLRGKHIAQRRMARAVIRGLNKFKLTAGNGKFDDLFLDHHFNITPKLFFDLILASHCLDENSPNGVKENAIQRCDALDWDIDLNLKKGNIRTREDYENYKTYLGYDVYFEYKLFESFSESLNKAGLEDLFYYLYMPGIRAFEDIGKNGVYVYQEKFREVRNYLNNDLDEIIQELNRTLLRSISKKDYKGLVLKYQKANKKVLNDINWSSDAQVMDILFNYISLPVQDLTDTGRPSVGESSLLRLRDKHKLVDLILQYRGVAIQISHFIDGWINRMQNGRLYPNFKLNGTVTGRTSCTDPNLQQVPRDPKIRTLIGAPPGYSFIEADFSQAELRIAAILSGDVTMKRIYQVGGDIHTTTYELIMGETVSDDKYIRKEQRKKAKAVNFGFLYGMGWKKFKEYARDTYGLTLTDDEAKDYRIKFYEAYKSLRPWHDRQKKIVKALGEVRNPINRVRRLPDIHSSDQGKRAEAERQSINSPVQGFGSDLTILGMIEVIGRAKYYNKDLVLDQSKFNTVGTVHDATLFEVRDDYLMEFIPKAKAIMESPKVLSKIFKFDSPIPMIVDISVGESWGNGKELNMTDDTWKSQVSDFLKSKGVTK